MTLHNLAYHGWTPRAALGQLGLALGDGIVEADADGIDLLLAGIDRAELVNTVSPGFAAEALTPAFGMGLDGALRGKGDRFIGHPQRARHHASGIRPPTRTRAAPYSRADRAGKAACRTDLLTRIGFDADDPGAVIGMIGRLDPQKGFDLLADAAPGLLDRGVRLVVQGSGHPELADPFRAIAQAAPGPGRVHRAVRSGHGPADLCRRRLLRHAVALRAVRPGPDDRAPLRHAADRPPRRRAGRHGHRRDDPPWRRHRLRLRRADRRATARGVRPGGPRCGRPVVPPGRACWIEAWRVDFDWVSGSAPRYVEAYRRAITIRG